MERPQIPDGGNGPQTWRTDAIILNKQWWMVDKLWSSNFDVGSGAKLLITKKKTSCYEKLRRALYQGGDK
jgi:hypothetical protein